jgi:hypothetical protein
MERHHGGKGPIPFRAVQECLELLPISGDFHGFRRRRRSRLGRRCNSSNSSNSKSGRHGDAKEGGASDRCPVPHCLPANRGFNGADQTIMFCVAALRIRPRTA